jgi:hypothetical protein
VHAHGSLLDPDIAPSVFGQTDARLLSLPFAGVAIIAFVWVTVVARRGVVVPSPSWPSLLAPQAQT